MNANKNWLNGSTYDQNGNVTTLNNATLTYDVENRLSQYTTGNFVENYAYDEANRRVDRWQGTSFDNVYFYGPNGKLLTVVQVNFNSTAPYVTATTLSNRIYFGRMLLGTTNGQVNTDSSLIKDRLGSVQPSCQKILPSQSTLMKDASDLQFFDARLGASGGQTVSQIAPGLSGYNPGGTLYNLVYGVSARVLNGPNGSVSSDVVLGTQFFMDPVTGSNADLTFGQGVVLIHELLHYATQEGDDAFAQQYNIAVSRTRRAARQYRLGFKMVARTSRALLLARIGPVFCLVTAMILPASPASAPGQTLWEQREGLFYSRSVLWREADLTESNIRSFYRSLSLELKGTRAWTVSIFVDKGDATRELYGKLATDGDYRWWLGLYNKFGRNLMPMAQIYALDANCLLRLRNGGGVSTETILSGENFLRVRFGNVDYEILETYFHPLPPNVAPTLGDGAAVSIYVRASSFPSLEQARKFSLLMRERYRQKRIRVEFRTDSYFLTDNAFPVLYRFDAPAPPPSLEEYERSKTRYCFCDDPAILCR